MNSNTREAIKNFVDQVQIMAQGVVRQTGTEDCGKLIDSAQALKEQLDSDETII
jgi:hypothetical protein